MYRHAPTVGDFLDPHPGSQRKAKAGLTNDLKKELCSSPSLGPHDIKRAELDDAERTRPVPAAATSGSMPGALATAVCTATAVPAGQTQFESDLLSLFTTNEEPRGGPAQ